MGGSKSSSIKNQWRIRRAERGRDHQSQKPCLNCDKNEKFHLFSEHHIFFKIFSILSNWNGYISENDEKQAKKISFSCKKKAQKNDISWQFSHFCKITILNFVFWYFLTPNYLDSFWKNFGNSAKELLSIAWNNEKFHFFLEHHIFSSIFLISSNCIIKFQKKKCKTPEKDIT